MRNELTLQKKNWFEAVQPKVKIDTKIDYSIIRAILKMDDSSLAIYEKL